MLVIRSNEKLANNMYLLAVSESSSKLKVLHPDFKVKSSLNWKQCSRFSKALSPHEHRGIKGYIESKLLFSSCNVSPWPWKINDPRFYVFSGGIHCNALLF